MRELGIEPYSFDNLNNACTKTLQFWVIKRELDSFGCNDLSGLHFSDVPCVLVLEINKQSGQSVSIWGLWSDACYSQYSQLAMYI